MRITIINEQDFIPVKQDLIRQAIQELPGLKKNYRLSLVYVDDREIASLNQRYLKHQGPTDVLAFPLDPKEGEVVVSAETALNEAQQRGIEARGELLLYTIHGVLHLLGYDDKTPEEAEQMHAIERRIIEASGYSWNWDAVDDD